jgi:hypothetical protein
MAKNSSLDAGGFHAQSVVSSFAGKGSRYKVNIHYLETRS